MLDEDKIRQLPCWNGSPTIAPLTGGLSNTNYRVEDANGSHVVRFGADYPFHHVSREREVMVARAAHAAGFAPQVEYAVPGVMVTEYLHAQTLTASDVRANPLRIAALMQRFHQVMPQHVSGAGFIFWPFHVIRDYIRMLQESPNNGARFAADCAAFETAQAPMPIVFGHHDLLPANFLDDGSRLWLIDYEYAGFGTAMFDLAGISSNSLMHPDEKGQLLGAYFGGRPDAAIEQSFAAMECASLLRETLWAMISGLFLAAPGVDYDAYTAENLARYEQALVLYQNTYGKITA